MIGVGASVALAGPHDVVVATAVDVRDATFSTNATAALPAGVPLNSMAQTADGKWIVATDGGLVRLNADGTKDSTYLGNYDSGGSNDNRYVRAMDVDAQGGAIISSGFWSGGIGRRLPDGSVDPNFALDLTNNGPYLSTHPRFIKVLPDGHILLAGGFDDTNAFGGAGLLKLTSTGDNVASFNTNVGDYLMGFAAPEVYDIEVDSQGRILMAVQSYLAGLGAIVRFNADGTPDTSFNQNVASWLGDPTSASNAIGKDIEVLPSGGYLVTSEFSGSLGPKVDVLTPGHPWNGDCWDVNLFKVTDSGASDTAFNGTYDSNGLCGARTVVGGVFSAEIGFPDLNAYTGEVADTGVSTGSFVGYASSVEVDSLGNVLLGGKFSTTDGGTTTGLVRLTATGSFVAAVEDGTANWSGWNPGNGSIKGTSVYSLVPSGDTILTFKTFSGAAIRRYSGNAQPAPTVTAVAPTSGTTAGGTAITITGTNFVNGSTVTVGGAACTNVTVVSATSITCTTPAGSAGTASVVVTAGGQFNAANALFTYNSPPPPPPAAPVTTAPPTTLPNVPALVNTDNQASLTRTPGAATAIVNGEVVEVDIEAPADLPAAQTDPEDRSPAQVAALQSAAESLVDELNDVAGGNSGLAVVPTPTGASISGLMSVPVPIENTVIVKTVEQSTVFAALNEDGSVTEVQPGAQIEVLGNGQVGVAAFGLTPGETVEVVLMSTPTLLGRFEVNAQGGVKAQAQLPESIRTGSHTLVVASPSVKASLGVKVGSAVRPTLPVTGGDADGLAPVALLMAVGAVLVIVSRRRVTLVP